MEELYSKFIKDIEDLEKALSLINHIDILRRRYPKIDEIENQELKPTIEYATNAKIGIQFIIASATL